MIGGKKMKQYYLTVSGKKIYVSEKVYKAYWSEKNKEKYLYQTDKKNNLVFFSQMPIEDNNWHLQIPDQTIDIEEIIQQKILFEKLHCAIQSLNDKDKELVDRLYYNNETLEEIAKSKNVSYQAIQQRKNKILNYLRKFF